MVEAENALINILQKLDLNYEEAQIYFSLLKYGKSGTIVRKLREDLPFIERTTLYSILRRLIEKGCAKEATSSNKSQKLKTFIATDPKEYFNIIFLKKKQEFEELQEIKTNSLDKIQKIYSRGLELSYEDLDPFILPYFEPLMKKGWKIKTQKISKGINIFGGEEYYEYHVQPPNNIAKKINTVGLIISIYDSEVERDDITLKFVIKQIKKSIKQLHKGDFNNISVLDDEIELFGNAYSSIIIKARERNSKTYLEFGKTAILAIKHKLIFIWEELMHDQKESNKIEQENTLKEIAKVILEVEKISTKENS
ncbi:MAG: helix-turn-helix domain-containing protein [Promethearchaeota archaeon]